METDYNILVRVVGENGQEVLRQEGWPWGAPTSDWPIREIRPDGRRLVIPPDTPPGLYGISIAFYDPDTLDRLPVTASDTGELIHEHERHVALIRVGAPPEVVESWSDPFEFADIIALNGAVLPTVSKPGDAIPLRLFWESRAATPVDYTVFVHVVDEEGNQVAGFDQQPRNGFAATHLWQPGQQIVDEFAIPLPTDLPGGIYEVRAGLYTQEDGRLPVSVNDQTSGDFAVLGQVELP
jgi:hypothetical protein